MGDRVEDARQTFERPNRQYADGRVVYETN